MMIYVPFIYFLSLAIIIIKKRGLDVSAYISLLYALTSFFSILYYNNGAPELYKDACSFFPTLIYCTLISLSILPVYKFNTTGLQRIVLPNTIAIKSLAYLYFVIFIVLLVAYRDDFVYILSFGDFAELRGDGVDDKYVFTQYGGVVGLVISLFSILASMSYIMIPVSFMLILSKNRWYLSVMALIGSLSAILIGVLGIDRSKSLYWVLILGLSIVVFWRNMSMRARKMVLVLSAIMLVGVLGYFASVTTDRFEDSDMGVEGGVVSYAGQPFINFCYFWENFDNGESFSTRYLFPIINYFILGEYQGSNALQQEMTMRTGIESGVFYSFLGNFILDNNQKGPFIYMLLYLLQFAICVMFVRRRQVSLFWFFYFLFLAIVPTCGIISYVYTSTTMKLSAWAIMIFVAMTYLQKK
ncbi:MAG: hypothetical protein IJX65_03095 [Alistipes sp.]|nr:hypothetical protein [Alistipes sp.]